MMNNLHKLILIASSFFMLSFNILAFSPQKEAKAVPEQMLPGTFIVYDENLDYSIVKGGAIDPSLLNENGLTKEMQKRADENAGEWYNR